MDLGWLSVLPPVAAIVLAIATRQVHLSLFFGIWMGWTVLADWNPLVGTADAIDSLVAVFESGYNTKVILFSALVGALITLTQRSGGVEGFVRWMRSLKLGRTPRSAQLVAWVTGVVVFVESSITCLVVGAVARPLCDEVKVSREKLAYVCDSTSAPVCILMPLNAWGAYVMGLLAAQGVEHPLTTLLATIPFNFYALAALFGTLLVVLTGWDLGPMRRAERRARVEGKLLADGATPLIADDVVAITTKEGVRPRKRNMLLPVATMIAMMPIGLFVTGRTALDDARAEARAHYQSLLAERQALAEELLATGRFEAIDRQSAEVETGTSAAHLAVHLEPVESTPPSTFEMQALARLQSVVEEVAEGSKEASLGSGFFAVMGAGSGATAVLWAVLAAVAVAALLYLLQGFLSLGEVVGLSLRGAGGLVPMAAVMILAFAINATCDALGTGPYVAGVVEPLLSPALLPGLLFLTACFIAFSTGTSWGTFGIMMPIGVPLAMAMGGSLPLTVAAILGGGVFGDHCSPISDTTVISSMATASDHIDHVKTQLPYALLAAAIALAGYLLAGFAVS